MPEVEDLSVVNLDSYVPLRMQVYNALREAILGGQLAAGEHLVEEKMCAQLGVSRSPLREALRRLEADGLVAIVPRQGAVVTEFTSRDLMDLFAVRRSLEGLAAALAANKISDEELAQLDEICEQMQQCIREQDGAGVVRLHTGFHEAIVEASRNKWLKVFMSSLRDHIGRVYSTTVAPYGRAPESLHEHLKLVAALRNHDAVAAEELAREDVQRAENSAFETEPEF